MKNERKVTNMREEKALCVLSKIEDNLFYLVSFMLSLLTTKHSFSATKIWMLLNFYNRAYVSSWICFVCVCVYVCASIRCSRLYFVLFLNEIFAFLLLLLLFVNSYIILSLLYFSHFLYITLLLFQPRSNVKRCQTIHLILNFFLFFAQTHQLTPT